MHQRLVSLVELHRTGALSDEEFARAKERLLSSTDLSLV